MFGGLFPIFQLAASCLRQKRHAGNMRCDLCMFLLIDQPINYNGVTI